LESPSRRPKKGIKTTTIDWGAPTLVIHDQDQNELFFWLPQKERTDGNRPSQTLADPA
jgi:hypothetical protein